MLNSGETEGNSGNSQSKSSYQQRQGAAEPTGGGWGLMLDPGKGELGKMQSFKTELMSAGTA